MRAQVGGQVVVRGLKSVNSGGPELCAFPVSEFTHTLRPGMTGMTSSSADSTAINFGELTNNVRIGPNIAEWDGIEMSEESGRVQYSKRWPPIAHLIDSVDNGRQAICLLPALLKWFTT